jgi:parallel beta-helix repeat protein
MLNLLTRRNTIMKFFRLPLSLLVVCVLVMSARPLTFDEKKSRYVVDSELVIAYSIVIPQGKTLIIKPGVKVIIDGYHSLTVRGLIIAEGTPDMPIIFTALDRKSGSREPPEWKGIEIVGKKASGQFRHCRFEGAYRNLAWSSSPSFDSCDFAGNHYGIYCADRAAPHIRNCRFLGNSYGIAADYAFPLLMNNIISENRIGMYLQLCSETVANKNRITANEVNIYSENAFGNNPGSFSLQRLWDLMQQLF